MKKFTTLFKKEKEHKKAVDPSLNERRLSEFNAVMGPIPDYEYGGNATKNNQSKAMRELMHAYLMNGSWEEVKQKLAQVEEQQFIPLTGVLSDGKTIKDFLSDKVNSALSSAPSTPVIESREALVAHFQEKFLELAQAQNPSLTDSELKNLKGIAKDCAYAPSEQSAIRKIDDPVTKSLLNDRDDLLRQMKTYIQDNKQLLEQDFSSKKSFRT